MYISVSPPSPSHSFFLSFLPPLSSLLLFSQPMMKEFTLMSQVNWGQGKPQGWTLLMALGMSSLDLRGQWNWHGPGLSWRRNVEETGESLEFSGETTFPSLQTAPTNILFHCSVWWWKACVGSETFLPLCCSSTGVIQWSTERTVLSLVCTTIHIAILIKLGRYNRTPQPSHRSSTKPSLFMNESSLRRQDLKYTSPKAEFRVTHELKKQGSFMCGARWLEVRKSEEMGGLHMHDPTLWLITGHMFRKRWH